MSAIVVAQSGRTDAYGAEELKRAAHRNGFTALAISGLIHFSVIGLYYLNAGVEKDMAILHPNPPRGPIIIVDAPSSTGGYAFRPNSQHAGSRPKGSRGIPAPVQDNPIAIEEVVDSGPGAVEGTDPLGGDGPAAGTTPGDGTSGDESPPEIWNYVEKEPVIVHSVKPVYPDLALRAGIEGKVFVRIWVDKQGKPRQVDIIRSDYEILNEAALEAARRFLFTPAYMNNGPVSVWVAVPFTFKIFPAR